MIVIPINQTMVRCVGNIIIRYVWPSYLLELFFHLIILLTVIIIMPDYIHSSIARGLLPAPAMDVRKRLTGARMMTL